MKLAVCTNFAQPFHTGGAERVIQQITESMTKDYGMECVVFCQHGSNETVYNGVRVCPVGKLSEGDFLGRLVSEQADHVFVYSDWFFRWDLILNHVEKIPGKKSIGLVGMNRMRSSLERNAAVTEVFRRKHQHFKVLAHADKYIDARVCREWGIPVSIIHNAIDLVEFDKPRPEPQEIRLRLGVTTSKMILCVANFFPGKGQEYLLPIIKNISAEHDVTLVFVSSTLAFIPGNRLQEMIRNNCQRMHLPVVFVKDAPRELVVQSYFGADAFVFPSQTECGPIVLLEAMAARKPWVALNVGHVPELRGGYCVEAHQGKGELLKFDEKVSKTFQEHIATLLTNEDLGKRLGIDGRTQVEEEYNWSKVKMQYRDFFLNA